MRFYDFGPYRLDPHQHRVTRNGEVVCVPPKALDALLLLVRSPGQVVKREALMEAIWPGVSVEDANLTVAISQLRKALGQPGETAEYVATVARVGYRFLPHVREVQEEPAPVFVTGTAATALKVRTSSRPVIWAVALGTLGIVAAIGAGLWVFRGSNATGKPDARLTSIAVLPLKSFSQTGEDQELRLRITDALITTLGRLNDVSVRPTHSILSFARENVDARQAGRQLNVEAVLDGRVQIEGERLRVTLQLVSVQTGAAIWSGQFDGAANKILDLQDTISDQLWPRLAHGAAAADAPTTHAAAYEEYLKGRYLWNKRTPAGYQGAIDCFQRAIALDPGFAMAYAGLADAYSMLTNFGGLPLVEGYARAKQMAQHALAIDPRLSDAHAALGWIASTHERRWEEAERSFARAIELNPNNGDAYHWRALNFNALGRTDDYFAAMDTARRIAPLTKSIARNYYDVVLSREGCLNAWSYLESFHALYDSPARDRAELSAYHHAGCGEYDRAIATLASTPIDRLSPKAQIYLAVAFARTGSRQKALETAKDSGLAVGSYWRSHVYVALGDFDSAFALLDRAIDAHEDGCRRLKHELLLAPLRADARFNRLLKRMNLPE